MYSRPMSEDENSFVGNEQGLGGQGDRRTKDEEEKFSFVQASPLQTRLEGTTRGLHRPRKLVQTTGQGFWGHHPAPCTLHPSPNR